MPPSPGPITRITDGGTRWLFVALEQRAEARVLPAGGLEVEDEVLDAQPQVVQRLLEVADVTDSGYQLYAHETIERIKNIRALKEERYTLQEIKVALNR